jgi:serine/threonine protein kinase
MSELPSIGAQFAGYRLQAELGRGMSVVYLAENPRLGSAVALKVLPPVLAADEVFRARFLNESRIAASLSHPNVIPIYDMGSHEDLLYIAMRYVSGSDLRQMVKKRGRIPAAEALYLTGQVARALDAAHREGLVHRDVKPGNLLIEHGSDENDPDHVYLADFGISKHATSRSGLTTTGQLLGTVDYIAPEQIMGDRVTGAADQYSLGCVLYECLTGRIPFDKDMDAAIIWAHVEQSPPRPTLLRPELPADLDEVFARVLAKQPADRYPSCREFIDAVRAALASSRQADVPTRHGTTGPRPDLAILDGTTGPHPDLPIRDGATGPRPDLPAQDEDRSLGGSARRPRKPSRSRLLAAVAALVLVAAGTASWVLAGGGLGSHPRRHPAMAMPSASASKRMTTSPLLAALELADKSPEAKGDLPPSTCRQQAATAVTCTAPALGITTATFRTYQTLPALYAAYITAVKQLNSGRFQPNVQDCEAQDTAGETSWNHDYKHTGRYSIPQSESGMLNASTQAAGRVFCDNVNGQEYMVWTQDDGHLLASVYGPVHEIVWNWWVNVHHNIGFGGPAMQMQMQK